MGWLHNTARKRLEKHLKVKQSLMRIALQVVELPMLQGERSHLKRNQICETQHLQKSKGSVTLRRRLESPQRPTYIYRRQRGSAISKADQLRHQGNLLTVQAMHAESLNQHPGAVLRVKTLSFTEIV
jgi:hypothetical protein